MASRPNLPPPPGNSAGPSGAGVSAPQVASSSPASPAPDNGTQMLLAAIRAVNAIAKAFPATAPDMKEALTSIQKAGPKMQSSQPTGEPAAPPQ